MNRNDLQNVYSLYCMIFNEKYKNHLAFVQHLYFILKKILIFISNLLSTTLTPLKKLANNLSNFRGHNCFTICPIRLILRQQNQAAVNCCY